MKPWWDAYPGRLEWEQNALRAEGIQVRRDDEAWARGFLRLHLDLPETYWLTRRLYAEFPDSYPSNRPEVYAPDLTLPHHQNPISKNLCLLERGSANWSPSWTLAKLLRQQLPLLAKSLEEHRREELVKIEVEQGEPLSEFFPYETDAVILIDSSSTPRTGDWGVLGIAPITLSTEPLRGYVSVIADAEGNELWSGRLGQRRGDEVIGSWVRLADAPTELDADRLIASLQQRRPELRRTPSDGGLQIVAVLFPEEVAHRRDDIGWIFLVRRTVMTKRGGQSRTSFVRPGRAGVTDFAARLPEFRQLQACTTTVFGLGCVGSPSALEFARAGMHDLRLVDHDRVEAGTAVRWVYGLDVAGLLKMRAVADAINRDYPWVELQGISTRIGSPNQQPPEREVVEQVLRDTDLVYDATAEIGVQQVLSTICRERRLPYMCLSATFGGWGGIVARFNHRDGSGCWWCFQAALDREIPLPQADPNGSVQPVGCNRVTYVGANFDLGEVALQGVRLAVATLLTRKGVPDADYPWDVAVVNLRDEHGRRIAPEWSVYSLARNPECPVCSR